nr:aminoacyl-tRNA synthetase, class 1a, anticodon-binding [Tanacetum cinerariifolium]
MKGFKFAMTFINISDKPNSGSHISKAKDGSLKLFYVASKYAVDADLEADFVPNSKETKLLEDLEEFDKLFLILKLLGKSGTCTVIMKGFKFAMTFINISDKPNSGSHISKAKDGSLKLFYVASKYAVDADLEVDFVPNSKETKLLEG